MLEKEKIDINEYYQNIKDKLIDNELTKKAKDYSKNKSDLESYYYVGKELFEAGKHYGENIVKQFSDKLTQEVGKKYSTTLLKRMRQFYLLIEKGADMPHFLSWSHYQELLSLNDINEINYYLKVASEQKLGHKYLREKIKSKEYERLDEKTKEKLKEENSKKDNKLVLEYSSDPRIFSTTFICKSL